MGEQFRTPTINLWFEAADYLKFIENIDEYLNEKLEQLDSDLGYPVGRLKDIKIHFMHYANFDDAKKKWDERKGRINTDRLYFMMVQCEGCTKEMVKKFAALPYKHKVIFTAYDYPDIECAIHISGTTNSRNEVIDLCQYKSRFTGKRWIDEFDYVEFLNRL